MKVRIRGVEYDPRNIDNTSPLHMIELQEQSKQLVEGGWKFSILKRADREAKAYTRRRKAWADAVVEWRAAGADPEAEPVEPDEPDTMWIALATITFLTIRGGGERITLEDAAGIPFREVAYVAEPGDPATPDDDEDAQDDTDPSSPASGGPATAAAGDEPAAAAPTPATTSRSSGAATP